jgi:hypothetical protein
VSESKDPRFGADLLIQLRRDIDRYGNWIWLRTSPKRLAETLADCIDALITLRNASMGVHYGLTHAIAERDGLRAELKRSNDLLESARQLSAQRREQLERAQQRLGEAFDGWEEEVARFNLIAEECDGAGHLVWHHTGDEVEGEQVLIVSCRDGETLRDGVDRALDELEEELETAPIEPRTPLAREREASS